MFFVGCLYGAAIDVLYMQSVQCLKSPRGGYLRNDVYGTKAYIVGEPLQMHEAIATACPKRLLIIR